jgi:hypothetical protein
LNYLYASNVSPADRFDQLSLLMDNGATQTLKKGLVYTLSTSERARASRYIVLSETVLVPEPYPASQTSGNIPWVQTDGDLVSASSGHPVVLVLADSGASGGAALRYWDGDSWELLSGSGGAPVGDFILVTHDNTLAVGEILVWNGSSFNTEAP